MRHITIKFIGLCFGFFLLSGCATFQFYQQPFGERPDVQVFIQQVSAKDNFNPQYLTYLFNQVTPSKPVLKSIKKPQEFNMTWPAYRAIFISPERAEEGAQFWEQNANTLAIAQKRYGVPPQIIVAIIGVETRYGRFEGKFRVIDALSSLAFNYQHRSHYFKYELEQYLLLTRENGLNPLDLYGSYAGAVGKSQFMPDNYRQYAICADGGHHADLWHNNNDVILSTANYFKQDGWQPGKLVAVQAYVVNNHYLVLDTKETKPIYTVGQLEKYGIRPKVYLPPSQHVNFMIFETETGPQFWLGLPNFNTIMKYNPSTFYSMTVYQLSEAILTAKEKI